MKILTFSSLYPNVAQPTHGLFVEQRLLKLVETKKVSAEVLAPVPWFPFKASWFGRYAKFARVPAREVRRGIQVHYPRYPVLPKVGMSVAPYLMAWALHGYVRKTLASGRDFDLIDAHYFHPDGVAAVMLGKWFAKPVTVTARGSDINVIATYSTPRRQVRYAARVAAGVITVSASLRDELVRLGVSAKVVEVMRNGVDLENFALRDRVQSRRELGLPDVPTLLIVSHLKEGKGHELVLEALRRMPEVTLLIVGEGPLRDRFERAAKSRGVAQRVRFCGAVAQDRLPAYYNAADVLVLASRREGLPNVMLESLACGTPVVATRVGGIPEVITESVAGVLLDGYSEAYLVAAISEMLAHPPERLATRRHAEGFSWDDTTQKQIELFDRITHTSNETDGG